MGSRGCLFACLRLWRVRRSRDFPKVMTDELKLAKGIVNGELELLCPEMQLLSCPDYRSSLFDGTVTPPLSSLTGCAAPLP